MELPGGVYSCYAHSDKWEFDLEQGLWRPFCCSEYFFAGLPHLSGGEYNDISSLKKEFESVEKENEDVLKTKISSLTKELESKRKELEDVVEKNASSCLQKDEEIRALTKELQGVRDKAHLRQIFSNFLRKKRTDQWNISLMIEARNRFREEFPHDKYPSKFTATIGDLLRKNEAGMELKLNCLREVAKSFRDRSKMPWWDEEKGEQFYILCINVARWNDVDFHPKVEGVVKLVCMNNACKGLYKLDGVDIGPFVKEALHT